MIAFATFALLVAARNHGVWGYLLRRPAPVDGHSFELGLSFGLWPLVLALAAWATAWGLGQRAVRAAGVTEDGGVVAPALGLVFIGQAVFFLGWAGACSPAALGALAAVSAAAGLSALAIRRPSRLPALGPAGALAAGVAAFAVFHLVVVSLAPPTSWDVRAYHLALPELYLRSGRVVAVPWLLHSHWPHFMESLYVLPLAAGRDGAAALLHAGACVLLAGGVYAAGGGWPAALLLAGQPALLRTAPTAHSDGACALFFFAAALALSRWEEKKQAGWLLAAGLLAGASASAKLFGAAGAAVWTLWLGARVRRPRAAALFALCATAVAGPWLLKVWLETGDPLWPLLRLTSAAADLAARNARTNLWNWPPPAWLLTHDGPFYLLGPLAGLALLSKGAKRATRLERLLWLPAPLLLALALRQHEAWRYLMPVYAAAALTGARLAAAALAAGGVRRALAGLLLAAGASPLSGLTQNNELFAVLGLRSAASPGAPARELYADRSVDVSAFYREARAALPPGSRVLLFREVRGYAAGFEYLWGDPINQNLIDYRRFADFDALRARLRELGVTHVLDHPGSHLYGEDPAYYDSRTLALMSGLLARGARPVLARDGLVLHRLL